jgi:hypothetical protein
MRRFTVNQAAVYLRTLAAGGCGCGALGRSDQNDLLARARRSTANSRDAAACDRLGIRLGHGGSSYYAVRRTEVCWVRGKHEWQIEVGSGKTQRKF